MIGSLADRIAQAMNESDRTWSSAEIARDFLKLTGSGSAADGLVRSLLRTDPRFRELGAGQWSVRLDPPTPILGSPLWITQFEPSSDANVWRVHVRLRDGSGVTPTRTLTSERAAEWTQVRRSAPGVPFATVQPTLVGRALGRMERTFAVAELEMLDLLSWVKVALREEGVAFDQLTQESRVPELVRRWGLGPLREGPEGGLDALSTIVDELMQRYPGWTDVELQRARSELLEPRPVDFARFGFSRQEIDALPTGSGIYRFRDDRGGLLYVGKAVSLSRRVGSYFRSLPPERTKREDLLDTLHTLEIEACPSELEALILESRAIRTEHPRWNVQIETHPPDRFPADWRWPLVFVPPSSDPARATVLVLQGRDLGVLLRVPREVDALVTDGSWLTGLVDASSEGPSRPPADHWTASLPFSHSVLDPEEVWLALRYFGRQRDLVESCEGFRDLDDLWGRLRAALVTGDRTGTISPVP